MQYTCVVRHGDVAQLGERSVRIREVEGSIPFVSTISTSEESAVCRFFFCVIDEALALREHGYGLLGKEAVIANNHFSAQMIPNADFADLSSARILQLRHIIAEDRLRAVGQKRGRKYVLSTHSH